jgi:glutamine synthetase
VISCYAGYMDAHRIRREDDPVALRVAERVETGRVDLVRFLYTDHDGIIRGKSASGRRIIAGLRGGVGHDVGLMAMTMLDTMPPVAGMGPVGEVRLMPDPTTYTLLPYAPGAAAMLADLVRGDGEPWEACPRAFLRSAVAELAGEGYSLLAAFEPEFTLGRRVPTGDGPDRLVPVDDSLCYSLTGFHVAHDYVTALVHDLEAQDLQVEHYHPEMGHGQQELSIRPADPVRAADNHVLYRETVRAVAMRQGLWASLAPKPIPGQAGNGAHLHLSLWSEGRNTLYDPDAATYALPEAGRWFVGGLIAHLPALTAFTCGSVNGFRRLIPRWRAGAYACYGPGNREAAIRICSPTASDPEGTATIELKPSDSSANPYLSLGAVILAGLDGIRRRTEPGTPVDVDPATLPEHERPPRLPTSLGEALDALEADEPLCDALGPLRRTAYLAVKRADAEAFAGMSPEQECFEFFTKF